MSINVIPFFCAVCINQIQLVCHSVITCFTLYSRAHWTHSCFLTLLNSPMFVKYQFAVVHLLIFPSIFSLQGGPLAFSVIISFSENSNVVWRVKWPTVQGHTTGILVLSHLDLGAWVKKMSEQKWLHSLMN